jgi:hypothetical protein
MPKLEALDNKGQRTGRFKFFTDSAYARIRSLKNPHWVLAEQEKPKQSRSNPVPEGTEKLKDFPSTTAGQHEWVNKETDPEKLKIAFTQANSIAVKKAIEEKLTNLK